MGAFNTDYVDVRIYRYKKSGNIMAETLASLTYTTDDNVELEVPAGFETNFASVPKIFWNLFPPIDKYTNASVLHDWLYAGNGANLGYSRKQCDKLFYQCVKESGIRAFPAWIMYISVRAFGAFTFTKATESESVDSVEASKVNTGLTEEQKAQIQAIMADESLSDEDKLVQIQAIVSANSEATE